MSPASRRGAGVAGRRDLDRGAFAEASGGLARDRDRRRAARSLADRRRPFVRADDRHRRRADATTHDPPARRLAADRARRGVCAGRAAGLSLRSAAYLGWRMPTLNELFRPFRAGPTRPPPMRTSSPERLAGAEAGVDYARGPLRAVADRVRQPAEGRDRQCHAGPGARDFPRRRLRRRGRHVPPARECRCGEGARHRGFGAWARGPWSVRAGASLTHARMDGERRRSIPRRPASGADAKFRGNARRRLGAGREGRAARAYAGSARSSTTISTRDVLEGRDDARRVRVLAADAPPCS